MASTPMHCLSPCLSSSLTVTIDGSVIGGSWSNEDEERSEDYYSEYRKPVCHTFSLYRSDPEFEDVESIREAVERTVTDEIGSAAGRLTPETKIVLERRNGVRSRKVYRVGDFERALREWVETGRGEGKEDVWQA